MVPTFAALFMIFVSGATASAQTAESFSYNLDPRFRVGLRLNEPRGPSNIDNQTDGVVTYGLNSQLTFQIGARFQSDAAYNADRDHYQTLNAFEGAESELREANVEYRSGPMIVRVGSQTVIWGEAFGTYYADLINPKDLRTAGFGDINDFRKPIEMVNLQYVQESWSLQLLVIPFYRPDRLPRPYSDFFPASVTTALARSGIALSNVDFDQSPDAPSKSPDLAFRYQSRLGAFDFSAFAFFHADRSPVFRVDLKSPSEIYLRTTSRPTNATGLTFSWAGNAVVVRGEFVHFANRSFNTLTGHVLTPIGVAASDQNILVLGADFPLNQLSLFADATNWQFGLQLSTDQIGEPNPLGRKQNESMVGFQILRDSDRTIAYRLFGGLSLGDSSVAVQASASKWIDENFKLGPELWFVQGSAGSRLGDIRQASRLMLVLKGAFRG
ncbi:hypothetical protein BH10BDE1_BH10BDE1_24320 [soil metagenome]